MPLSKKGSYHANPAIAAMHDGPAPIADPGAQSDAHTVEIHSPSHPETGDGQSFTSRVHHGDGSVEDAKHASYDEAAAHGGEALGAGENTSDEYDDAGECMDESGADDEY